MGADERKSTDRHTGNRYVSFDNTSLVAKLLVEGNSLLSTARVVGIEEKTVALLLSEIGDGCASLLRSPIQNFDSSHLEIDEVWTFGNVGQLETKFRPD